LLAVVEKAGLRISVLFATPRTDVSSAAAEASTLASFLQYRDYAARIGCQALGISSPAVAGPGLPVTEKADQLRRLAGLMNDLAVGAPDGRLSIAVDIHYNSLVESVADALFLVKAMPETRAGLILNVGHLTTAHQEGWRLLEEVPDRVHVIGWKDHSLAPDRPFPMYSVELGTGDTPFERYLGALQGTDALRPVHLVNVEHAPKGAEVPALQRSIAYLRDLWTQVL
jgi:sugar phosphate isomerase/epimerase